MFISSVAATRQLVAPTTAYANSGGTGDRTALITITSNITPDGGTINNLIDGAFVSNSTDAIDMPGTGSTAIPDGAHITCQFASLKYVDEVTLKFDVVPSMGNWLIRGSNDGVLYATYGTFNWNTATQVIPLTGVPAEGHFYWQMIKNGAGSNYTNSWFREIEFKIAAGAT